MKGDNSRDPLEFAGVFCRFRLDLDRRRLYRLDQAIGEVPIRLGNRAFDLLHKLLEQREKAVSKADLKETVWGAKAKSDNWDYNLRVEINKLRTAFSEDVHNSCIRRTREGYALVEPRKRPDQPSTPAPQRADRPIETLQPTLGFDDRPAVAVLPFANVSGDPNQDYFADGITYNIISELASWRAFPVIGRGSTFAFKDRAIDIQSLGKQLGARYLVDGSAAKTTTRVEVTALLIDATNGQCLVPERHERNVGDLFEIQRDIVEVIVGSIAPEVLKVESERVERRRPPNPTSYEYVMRGLAFHYRYTKQDNVEAQRLFRQAIEADMKNAQAHALLAVAMNHAVQQGWRPEHDYEIADNIAARAVSLDRRAPFAHFAYGATSTFRGRIEQGLAEMQEAVRVNPSHAAAHAFMANLLCCIGRPAAGLESAKTALRLSPHDPRLGLWIAGLSQAHYFLEQYEDAVAAAQWALSLVPINLIASRFLAASLGQLGMIPEAAPVVDLLRHSNGPTLAHVKQYMEKFFRVPKMVTHVLGGLGKAGMS